MIRFTKENLTKNFQIRHDKRPVINLKKEIIEGTNKLWAVTRKKEEIDHKTHHQSQN